MSIAGEFLNTFYGMQRKVVWRFVVFLRAKWHAFLSERFSKVCGAIRRRVLRIRLYEKKGFNMAINSCSLFFFTTKKWMIVTRESLFMYFLLYKVS